VPSANGGTGAVRAYDRSASAYKNLTFNDAVLIAGGNVGVGSTQTPPVSVIEAQQNLAGPVIEAIGLNPALSLQSSTSTQENAIWTQGAGVYVDSVGHATPASNFIAFRTTNTAGTYTPREVMRVTSDGNVNIGNASTNVTANLNVNGTITGVTVLNAVYQDIAEWVSSSADLQPATVVVLDRSLDNHVLPSNVAYDTAVAGVVSATPGVVLGVGGAGRAKIATTGRVKVRVDATAAPIEIGDLLVTSDRPGTAMKSQPIEINGRRFHQPGTVIGKALQPLNGGQGEILVLLSLQ
jgi:hypothetical protein